MLVVPCGSWRSCRPCSCSPARLDRAAARQVEDRGAGAGQVLRRDGAAGRALVRARGAGGRLARRRPLVVAVAARRAGRVAGGGDAGRSGDPGAPVGGSGRSAARRSSSASARWRAGCGWTSSRLTKCRSSASVTSTALVAGTGQSRRVFIASDVLRDWSDEEIAVVVAHEFGAPRAPRSLVDACRRCQRCVAARLWPRPVAVLRRLALAPGDLAALPVVATGRRGARSSPPRRCGTRCRAAGAPCGCVRARADRRRRRVPRRAPAARRAPPGGGAPVAPHALAVSPPSDGARTTARCRSVRTDQSVNDR